MTLDDWRVTGYDGVLEPVLDAMRRASFRRVVVRQEGVDGEGVAGFQRVELQWTAAHHEALLAVVPEEGGRLNDGTTVGRVGDAVVLMRPPDPQHTLDVLVHDGWLPALAATLLDGALELGRNILVVGPWARSVELASALLAGGVRPAVVGGAPNAVPPGWAALPDLAAAQAYGPDRMAAWSSSPTHLVQLLTRSGSMVGCMEARRLEQALMRYEAAVEGLPHGASPPLHVLAGLDLVVVLSSGDAPRVREIAEIGLGDEGYRPRMLFSSQQVQGLWELVSVGTPQMVNEAMADGPTRLGMAYQRADTAVSQSKPAQRILPRMPTLPPGAETNPAVAPMPPVPTQSAAYEEPAVDVDDLEPPGWELDQLEDADLAEQIASGTEDEASMAARYGLGPPPPPAGSAEPKEDTPQPFDALMHGLRRNRGEDES